MNVMFVSFYTQDNVYEKEVKHLIASCQKLGLSTDIVPIVSKGRWDENCSYKSHFLLKMLKKHQKPIVWIDADAIILQKPILFETLTCDIGVRILDLPFNNPSKILSGTIYLNNTQNSHILLKLWGKENQELIKNKKSSWDQIALKNALLKMDPFSLFPLPAEYCEIYDHSFSKKESIILHYQASRILKKGIFKESESIKRSLHRNIILKKYGITP